MRKHHSLLVAGSVLNRLMKDPFAKKCPAIIQVYKNGREQGYSITDTVNRYSFAISFAENRNSDQIVIYAGHADDSGLSPTAYANGLYFSYNDISHAVDLIVGYLKAINGDFQDLPKLVNSDLPFVRTVVETRLSYPKSLTFYK